MSNIPNHPFKPDRDVFGSLINKRQHFIHLALAASDDAAKTHNEIADQAKQISAEAGITNWNEKTFAPQPIRTYLALMRDKGWTTLTNGKWTFTLAALAVIADPSLIRPKKKKWRDGLKKVDLHRRLILPAEFCSPGELVQADLVDGILTLKRMVLKEEKKTVE